MKKIILASTSSRRQELFARLGLPFESVASSYEEDMTLDMRPIQLAKHLSLGKARAVAAKYRSGIIIGADTFIALGNEVLGKPHTPQRARAMLKKLSGKKHQVITGLTVIDIAAKKTISKALVSDVYFKKLSLPEIDRYIKTKEPLDKAGAYAIQGKGALFVKKIEGDYYTIMGLPLFTLAACLEKLGVL